MAAPKGNQFWKLQTKHGRDKIFNTPEILWKAATEYFEWIDTHPLIQIDYKGKDAEKVEIPHIRPYTIHGLCLYLKVNVRYFNDFENGLKGKDDEKSQAFSTICTRIRETIYNQKFSGAAVGFYNAVIISRDLGLSDKNEVSLIPERSINITIDGEKIDLSTE